MREARSALEGVKERHALGGVAGLSIRARSFIRRKNQWDTLR